MPNCSNKKTDRGVWTVDDDSTIYIGLRSTIQKITLSKFIISQQVFKNK
jgi:hypothetical protein